MSYTTLYKVPRSGEIEEYATFRNAFQGAFNIWTEVAKSYLGMEYLPADMEVLWKLSQDHEVIHNDRIVLATTFDYVMIRREHLLVVAEAMDDFCRRYEPGHLPEQAEKLRELAQDESCYAACWRQTSVTDMWMVRSGELDEYDDPRYLMYDVSEDTDHWFLFDKMPLPV